MPAPRRRLHRVASEEDASQLKLGNPPHLRAPQISLSVYLYVSVESAYWECAGHEFNDADTLTTSEAKLLIDVVLTKRPKDTGEEMPMTEYRPVSSVYGC